MFLQIERTYFCKDFQSPSTKPLDLLQNSVGWLTQNTLGLILKPSKFDLDENKSIVSNRTAVCIITDITLFSVKFLDFTYPT